MHRLLILAFFPMFAIAAPCGQPQFTEPQYVNLSSEAAMIVTHPSTQWDGRFSSKMGMDAAVQFAKSKNIPVVYLQDKSASNNGTYFFADCRPDYYVASSGGEFSFAVNANHIYSVGGHWELCQATSQKDLMNAWANSKKGEDLTYTQVMDGLYMYGGNVRSTDPYFADFNRFIEIVSYGNPRDYWYVKKLSLLEMMGIIKSQPQQIEFLKRNLPPYAKLGSDYKVVLELNGKEIEVLQVGKETNPPLLKVQFVNTLYTSGKIPVRLK